MAQELAGGGEDDADVVVQDDVGPGVGSSDAEAVQPVGVAQRDDAAVVDAVVAYPVVRTGSAAVLGGFRSGGVAGRRGRLVWR